MNPKSPDGAAGIEGADSRSGEVFCVRKKRCACLARGTEQVATFLSSYRQFCGRWCRAALPATVASRHLWGASVFLS